MMHFKSKLTGILSIRRTSGIRSNARSCPAPSSALCGLIYAAWRRRFSRFSLRRSRLSSFCWIKVPNR